MASINAHQKLLQRATKKLIPLNCLFELTYKCNLRCVHCYVVKEKNGELGKREIFNTFDQLQDAGCLNLTLSGGEIFVRKDFFEIAEYARKLNFALKLFTNGTLIDEGTARKIKKLDPLIIEISLYGFRLTHDKITRVSGSFDKTIKAIRLLKKRKIKVVVKTVVMKQNTDEIWRLAEFIENDLGVKIRNVASGLFISPANNGSRRPLKYRLTDEQLKRHLKEEFRQFKSSGKEFKLFREKPNLPLCAAGLTSCSITPYGEVNPCVQMRVDDNNLNEKPFIKIWKENEGFSRLRSLRVVDRKDCWGCELVPYCVICPGMAGLEEGSLLAKFPEACRQSMIRKEFYGNG
jgi:AdoMet-dependent heme synthase